MSQKDMKFQQAQGEVQLLPTYKTLRDEIAIEVMKIILSAIRSPSAAANDQAVARLSYQMADAMLSAREKEVG